MEKKASWLTDKYICAMLLLFPLWTGFRGYADITFSKFIFFAVLTGAWLLSLIVCAVVYRYRPRKPDFGQWCALAFMLAVCLSALFSPYGSKTVLGASRYDGAVTLLLYGGIYLGVSRWGSFGRYYVNLLAVSASLCCVVAIIQLCGRNPLWLYPDGLNYFDAGIKYSGEFLGTIGNADLLAAFFCLCVPMFVYAAIKWRRLYLIVPTALCLAVLILSRVASGVVALFAGALIAVPCCVKKGRRKYTLALSAAIAVSALIFVYFYNGTSGTLYEASRVLHGEISDSFGSNRVRIWRECAKLFTERPLLGGGPDTLTLRSGIDFSRYVPETGATLRTHVDNAHCEPLGYLVNLGLLGLLPYLLLCGYGFYRGASGRGSAVFCSAVCYFIQSLFGLGLCIIAPLFWITLGLEVRHDEPKPLS